MHRGLQSGEVTDYHEAGVDSDAHRDGRASLGLPFAVEPVEHIAEGLGALNRGEGVVGVAVARGVVLGDHRLPALLAPNATEENSFFGPGLLVLALVVANLVPVAGMVFMGWELSDVMVLYWAESAIIGLFNIAKIFSPESGKFSLHILGSENFIGY